MKKILGKIKQKNIDILIIIVFAIALIALYRELMPGDELWNFADIYKMNNGYTIYKDLNIVTMPLFFYAGQIFLKIFGNNYFGFSIYNIAIYIILFIMIFKIFRKLNIKRRRAIIYIIGFLMAFETLIAAGANYNVLVLLPILFTVSMLISRKNNPYMLGIIAGIAFLIKQNIGIYFLFGILIYQILEKQKFKNLIKTLMSFSMLFIIFIVFMIQQGTLYDFINYTFLGVSEFASKNIWITSDMIIYPLIFTFIIVVSIFICKSKKINLEKSIVENVKILLSIGIPLLLFTYPIMNYYHFMCGGLILIIEFVYLIDQTLIKELVINVKREKSIYIILILLYLFRMFLYLQSYISDMEKYAVTNTKSPYYGALCDEKMMEEIDNICNYVIENEKVGVDVKILSARAQLYMLPLNKNNKNFDLPLLGNLGEDGEEGIIMQIKMMKNTKLLLVTNEEDIFLQESKKVRKFVKENYQKEGTIECFDIYYINN